MRQLRADFAGALHHVYNRGLDGRDIFVDDADRMFFLFWLGQMVEKFGWVVHAYTLMTNHFHLFIETPEGCLSKGMQRDADELRAADERTANARGVSRKKRKRRGPLLEGRFRSHLVEMESYPLELSRYTVPPIRRLRENERVTARGSVRNFGPMRSSSHVYASGV